VYFYFQPFDLNLYFRIFSHQNFTTPCPADGCVQHFINDLIS